MGAPSSRLVIIYATVPTSITVLFPLSVEFDRSSFVPYRRLSPLQRSCALPARPSRFTCSNFKWRAGAAPQRLARRQRPPAVKTSGRISPMTSMGPPVGGFPLSFITSMCVRCLLEHMSMTSKMRITIWNCQVSLAPLGFV